MKKKTFKRSSKLPFRTAMLWICLTTFFTCGTFFVGFLYYKKIQRIRYQEPQYNIVAIVQTTPDKERLKTVFLSELFNLSIDKPTNLLQFNASEAEKKLLSLPMITSAQVKKILPGTIYTEYSMRKPLAYLLDYSNVALDSEGVAFPFKPFFTPKKLPEIYLGNFPSGHVMGKPINTVQCKLALYLLSLITEQCCAEKTQLVRIDVSKALADSYGQRQIVVILEDQIERNVEGKLVLVGVPQMLRLSVDHYRQELANYLALRPFALQQGSSIPLDVNSKTNRTKPIIIDLRIQELAYITKGKE